MLFRNGNHTRAADLFVEAVRVASQRIEAGEQFWGLPLEMAAVAALRGDNKEAVAHNFITQDGNYSDILQTETIVVLQGPLYKDSATTLPSVLTVGVGNAFVFNNDKYVEGTWRRGDINEPFVLTDLNGIDIQVPPSTQWVHILPNEGEILIDN